MNFDLLQACYAGVALAAIGCGGSDLAPVSGRVTMDGEPVQGARIVTQPMNADSGSPGSYAVTDSSGGYQLQEIGTDRRGASVAVHSVRITKMEVDYAGDNPDVPNEVQNLLPKYAASGELKIDVSASGEGSYDFQLSRR